MSSGVEHVVFHMPEGGDVQESLAHAYLHVGVHHGPKNKYFQITEIEILVCLE